MLSPSRSAEVRSQVCLSAAKFSTPQQSSQIHFRYKLIIKAR